RVGQDKLEYRWGLLYKQHRQVRYDRIQSVDITRPFMARLVGLSQVVVQSAGGSDSHVELSYLTHTRALEVRDAVLSRVDAEEAQAAALPPCRPGDAVGPAGQVTGAYAVGGDAVLRGTVEPTRGRTVLRTIKVPTGRLVLSLLYHPVTVLIILAVPAVLLGSIYGSVALLPAMFPIVVGLVIPHGRRFLNEANFVV